MAKLNHGILTKGKNKLGGVVFQQYEGLQVAKEYQPNVKNPQTPAQMQNRMAFKLASVFTGRWYEVLQHLKWDNNYSRFNRGKITSIAKRYTLYDTTTDTEILQIPQALSDINSGRANNEYGTPVIDSTNETIAASIADADAVVIYKTVVYDANGNVIGQNVESIPASTTDTAIVLPVVPLGATPTMIECMAVEVTPNTDEGRALMQRVSANASTSTYEYLTSIARSVAAGDNIASIAVYAKW